MQYKLSYYTIISDPVKEDGTCVVYSTKTGSISSVSQLALDYIEAGYIDEIPEEIVNTLVDKSILVPAELDELAEIVRVAPLPLIKYPPSNTLSS